MDRQTLFQPLQDDCLTMRLQALRLHDAFTDKGGIINDPHAGR